MVPYDEAGTEKRVFLCLNKCSCRGIQFKKNKKLCIISNKTKSRRQKINCGTNILRVRKVDHCFAGLFCDCVCVSVNTSAVVYLREFNEPGCKGAALREDLWLFKELFACGLFKLISPAGCLWCHLCPRNFNSDPAQGQFTVQNSQVWLSFYQLVPKLW